MKAKLLRALELMALVSMSACFSSAATTSVVPTTGVSATNVSSNTCSGQMWNCVNDAIGSPDSDTTYVYKISGQTSGEHVIGFSGSISNITAITMHIVAATDSTDPNAAGTAQMIFYNNGAVAGTGGVKTLTSAYKEYVSGVFNTSISGLSNITMKVILTNTGSSTGILKYTAAWLDVTYGGAGTTLGSMDTHLLEWQNADGSPKSDFVWTDGTGYLSASCTSTACAGGAGGTSLTVASGLTPPATPPAPLSPTATEISVSGGNSGDPSALEWVKQKGSTATDAAVSLQGDWWVYLEASTSTPHTLEFDTFWGNGSHVAMWGSHCNFSSQVWEADAQDGTGWKTLIDAQTGSGIPCNLSKNAWHHITWQIHQDATAGKIYYDYLTIDGTTYIVDYTTKVHGYKASTWDTIGSQVQQDMNSLHQAYNEWIDGMSLTYW
jgi:hypothetical protein